MFSPVSAEASAIASLFVGVLWVCAGIFLVVIAILAVALLGARRKSGDSEPAREQHRPWLEITWTAVPILIVMGIFGFSLHAATRAHPTPTGDPDIIVVGHQWWWEIRYPKEGVVTANEIHIPTGSPLHVQLESADVVHSFWVPQVARKMDLIPGVANRLQVHVEREGTFEGACAEFCGTQHAWMRLLVVAHPPKAYDDWLDAQRKIASPPRSATARAGRAVYERETCGNCHALRHAEGAGRGPSIGPDLTHLASRRDLGAGVAANTAENLVRWMADPQRIKQGSHMPKFQLSPSDSARVAAYLSELR